jgi:hypothetical protein
MQRAQAGFALRRAQGLHNIHGNVRQDGSHVIDGMGGYRKYLERAGSSGRLQITKESDVACRKPTVQPRIVSDMVAARITGSTADVFVNSGMRRYDGRTPAKHRVILTTCRYGS